jgi:hypothetical protein
MLTCMLSPHSHPLSNNSPFYTDTRTCRFGPLFAPLPLAAQWRDDRGLPFSRLPLASTVLPLASTVLPLASTVLPLAFAAACIFSVYSPMKVKHYYLVTCDFLCSPFPFLSSPARLLPSCSLLTYQVYHPCYTNSPCLSCRSCLSRLIRPLLAPPLTLYLII